MLKKGHFYYWICNSVLFYVVNPFITKTACAWRNFKNIFSRPLFTIINARISPIFYFDRVNYGRICHIMCVKTFQNTKYINRGSNYLGKERPRNGFFSESGLEETVDESKGRFWFWRWLSATFFTVSRPCLLIIYRIWNW